MLTAYADSAALRHNKQETQTGTKADVTTDYLSSGILVNSRNWKRLRHWQNQNIIS